MITAKSTVKINLPRIKQLTSAAVTALEMTAETLHTEILNAQVMPFDNGDLQNKNTFVDCSKSKSGKVSIITQGPQARRLYFHPEYNFQTVNNPNAGGQWFETYVSGSEKDFAAKAFKEHYKNLGGV